MLPDSDDDQYYVRSGLYGSFLSGGLAGFIYGAEGIWNAEVEAEALYPMWQSFEWRSGGEVAAPADVRRGARLALPRARAEGRAGVPNKTGPGFSYYGWAYCARTPERDLFLLYFEKDAPLDANVRGAAPAGPYRPRLFDPARGRVAAAGEPVTVAPSSVLTLPARPDERDWGLILERLDKSGGQKRGRRSPAPLAE